MKKNSYQGYEVQKPRAIMMGKMYFRLVVLCLARGGWHNPQNQVNAYEGDPVTHSFR